MPSPAEPAAAPQAPNAAAGKALVAAPGLIAVLVGGLTWMLSVDLNPADKGYPRALAALLIAVGLWNIVADLREHTGDEEPDAEYGRLVAWRVVAFAALVAVTVWLVNPIGFYPAAAIMLIGGLWIMGIRKPLPLIVYPVVVIAIGYVLFSMLIGVPLPLARGF
ncbi:tripartite tricarboxylate transporter TctB family protein [Mycobacterium sp. C31M]